MTTMAHSVEEYRGVLIYLAQDEETLDLAQRVRLAANHMAQVSGWRIIGPLESVREQIDRLLKEEQHTPLLRSLAVLQPSHEQFQASL
jgi:hypothetical protein